MRNSEQTDKPQKRKKWLRRILINLIVILLLFCLPALIIYVILPVNHYAKATKLMEEGQYAQAIIMFSKTSVFTPNYMDSAAKIAECKEAMMAQGYAEAEALLEAGETAQAAIAFGKLGGYRDARAQSLQLWEQLSPPVTLAAGADCTKVLRDGTPLSTNEAPYTPETNQLRSISARDTVLVPDDAFFEQHRKNVVALSTGVGQAEYLMSDGTVWHAEFPDDRAGFIAVSTGRQHIICLKWDGTLVAGNYGNSNGQCNIKAWTDIVAICAGEYHSVGLKADGTVVAVGKNDAGQCDVSGWADIVAISAGNDFTVGLKRDGTIVLAGQLPNAEALAQWTNITQISAGANHVAGMDANGIVVAAGDNSRGQCDVDKLN